MDVDQIVGEQQQQIVQRLERTGAHSHIRGLGLDDKLEPIEKVCFFFGMKNYLPKKISFLFEE